MNKLKSKNQSRIQRKKRIRARISGSANQPRISVFKSLKNIRVQVIDDISGKTLLSAGTKESKLKNDAEGSKKLGKILAEKCFKAGIKKVVFDRSGYKFHGKIKNLAQSAREGGLIF
ncbi:MAG: 50S ribosomal protein L18 [Candidatus Moranbacteria bacterium CG_4_9_14_3_um_filter_40_7]|nr:MAG: 50S ribosomal protein L18 [Candidatus Moranbacteria bacterium CG_4_9_14_3_um_filter_40_7]